MKWPRRSTTSSTSRIMLRVVDALRLEATVLWCSGQWGSFFHSQMFLFTLLSKLCFHPHFAKDIWGWKKTFDFYLMCFSPSNVFRDIYHERAGGSPNAHNNQIDLLAAARKLTASREMLLWMTPSEAPKALQASECSELLDPMRASCGILAQH